MAAPEYPETVIVSLFVALLVGVSQPSQTASSPAVQASQPPVQAPSAASTDEAPAPPRDPAEVLVTTPTAVILVPVKAALATDYEAALTLLQGAFSSSQEAEVRAVATGWKVLKATEADSKGSLIYVHLLQPTVDGVDYRPSVWMDRLVKDLPLEVLDKYRDSLAGPASLLSLSGVATMSEAPVPPSDGGAAPTKAPGGPVPAGTTGAATPPPPPARRPGGPGR